MGLFKFLLIAGLVFWLVSRVLGYFLRTFLQAKMNVQGQQRSYRSGQYQDKRKDNIHIDHVPDDYVKSTKDSKDKYGGDYVDYEELK